MKSSYLLKGLAGVALVALTLVSCQTKENAATAPTVGISASSAKFADGKATVTLSLSAAATSDVSVTLEASGTLAGKAAFEKSPVIAAGTTSLPVEVTLNPADAAGSLTVTVAAASGATVGKNASVTLTAVVTTVVLDYDNFNDEGVGKLVAILSSKAARSVTVEIAFSEDIDEGTTLIPEDNLTFQTTLSFAKGEDEAEMEISIKDMELLSKGLNQACFVISSVDGGPVLGETVSAKPSYEVVVIEPLRVPLWYVNYQGTTTYQGTDYDVLYVANEVHPTYSLYSQSYPAEYFAIVLVTEEDLESYLVEEEGQEEKNLDVAAFFKDVQTRYAEVAAEKGLNVAKDLCYDAPGPYWWNVLEDEEYYAFIIEFTENGKVTGNFGLSSFTKGPASDAYSKWLGNWKFGERDFTLTAWENDYSYGVSGFVDGFDFPAYYNPEEDRVEFYFEDAFVSTDGTVLLLSGIDNNGWVASGGDNTSLLAYLEADVDAFKITPNTDTFVYNGQNYTSYPVQLGALGYGKGSSGVGFLLYEDVELLDIPVAATKVEASAAGVSSFGRRNLPAFKVKESIPMRGTAKVHVRK